MKLANSTRNRAALLLAPLSVAAACSEPLCIVVTDHTICFEEGVEPLAPIGAEAQGLSNDGVGQDRSAGATCGGSWRDTLPALPPSARLPETLAAGSGSALASCDGDGVIETGSEWGQAESSNSHVVGRYYFEVESLAQDPEANISAAGVYAPPAAAFDIATATVFQEQVSAGGGDVAGGVTGFAVDLDAGVVATYDNGVLVSTTTLLLLPGVDAFRAAASPWYGENLALNLGAAPFAFAPPEGFAAWNSNADGSGGVCVAETAAPIAAAPVAITGTDGYAATSYTTDANADVELVVLGAYDTGSVANWAWGEDGEQLPVEGAHAGSALVTINRPGRIALVLSAYEPTDWTLVVGAETQLESVSVFGLHGQTVAGVPDGVRVDVRSMCTDANGGGNCTESTGDQFPVAPHQWPFDTGGGDTQGFISFVEQELCLPLKHFAGAYLARSFTVN